MSFDLQSESLPGLLATLWPGKVIREMSYRELRGVMTTAPEDWRAEAIAAASIDVPLDDLLNVPGRYAGEVAVLLSIVTRLHGLGAVPEGLVDSQAVNGAEVKQEATDNIPKH